MLKLKTTTEDPTVSQAFAMYRQLKSRLLIDADNDDSGAVGLELGEGRTRARKESVGSVGSPSVQSKPVP